MLVFKVKKYGIRNQWNQMEQFVDRLLTYLK